MPREKEHYRDRLAFIREHYGDNLNVKQAAEYLGKDRRTVERYIKKRMLAATDVSTGSYKQYNISASALANL